jgi:hypothetical protein
MLCGETGFLKTIDVANTASDFSVSDSGASDFSGSGGGVSADSVSDTPGGRREYRRRPLAEATGIGHIVTDQCNDMGVSDGPSANWQDCDDFG